MLSNGISGRGVAFAGRRLIDRYLHEPKRRTAWRNKAEPFDHTTPTGHRFRLNPGEFIDEAIFVDGLYERRFIEFVATKFPRDSISLDIGANIGNHAIALARTFAKTHAFEPNPRVIALLEHNIALNNLSDAIEVHPVGLGNVTSVLPFAQHDGGNLGNSGFVKEGQALVAERSMLNLRIEQADQYIAALQLPRLDYIKVDVEGWEPQLFEGLTGTIAKFRPVVAFEHHAQDSSPEEFATIRRALPGYTIVEAQHAPSEASALQKLSWNLRHAGQPELIEVIEPEIRTYENLLAFPDADTVARFGGLTRR